VDLNGLGAGLALDVAAPVVLAVAVVSYNHRLGRVTTTTTHRLTALRTRRVFLAHPVYTRAHCTRAPLQYTHTRLTALFPGLPG